MAASYLIQWRGNTVAVALKKDSGGYYWYAPSMGKIVSAKYPTYEELANNTTWA